MDYSRLLYINANNYYYCYNNHMLVYVYKQALYISIFFVYNDKMFWMYTDMWKINDKKNKIT